LLLIAVHQAPCCALLLISQFTFIYEIIAFLGFSPVFRFRGSTTSLTKPLLMGTPAWLHSYTVLSDTLGVRPTKCWTFLKNKPPTDMIWMAESFNTNNIIEWNEWILMPFWGRWVGHSELNSKNLWQNTPPIILHLSADF